MPQDIEGLLRQSLQARAEDVRPDPQTWTRVQSRFNRQRALRLGLAGLSAAAAVLVAVMVVPGLLDRPDVVFPGPAGGGDPVPPPGPPVPCGDTTLVTIAFSVGDALRAGCADGGTSWLYDRPGVDRNPVFSPDGAALLFDSGDGGPPAIVHLDLGTLREQVIGGGELPAFAPDGSFAYVQQSDGEHPRVLVGQLFSEPEQEIAVQHEVVPGPLTVRRLAWDTVDDYLLYETVDHEGDSRVWAVHVETARHELLEPHEQMYYAPAVGPDGTIAVISHDGLGTYELGYLDRAMLTGAGPSFTPVTRLDVLGDHGDEPFLAAAGYAWFDEGRWVRAERQSWIVGNGRVVWLVNEDGEIVELHGATHSMAVNPGADLGPGEHRDVIELEPRTGLPHNVEVTRQRVYAAARARDFGGLHALMAAEFSWSFGGNLDRDEAIEHLRDNPELLDVIADLLEGPHAFFDAESADAELYVWPREFVETDEYLDHRLVIDADGVWRYFIAGD